MDHEPVSQRVTTHDHPNRASPLPFEVIAFPQCGPHASRNISPVLRTTVTNHARDALTKVKDPLSLFSL